MHYSLYIKMLLGFAVIIISVTSCQEPYNVDDLDNTRRIPVFEGTLTDQPGPYKVTISWAKSFDTKNSNFLQKIVDAQVYIKDNQGTIEKLTNLKTGEYVTQADGIQGTIGRSYQLYVKLSNGYIYESLPTKLLAAETIDSLYAESGTYNYPITNEDGELIIKTFNGIFVYADIKSKTDFTRYFKFSNYYVLQRMYLENPGPFPTAVYFRTVRSPDVLPDVKSSVLYEGYQVIKKHKLFFIPYIYETTVNGDTSLPPQSVNTNMGWVVLASVKTVSKESHDYYQSVYEQLKAGSQLFDPIPSQIKGNIICRNDTNQLAIGLFDVYSESTKYRGFYWIPGNTLKTKDITDPGPLIDDTSKNEPQPYWVDFIYNK